jgi:UDP-glucose 4-epimerase
MLNAQTEEQVEVFNLGTGRGLSVLEILETFIRVTGVNVPYEIVDRREGDIEQVWAKPDKANKVLNWSADTPIEEVLLSAWKWEQKIRSLD